MLAPTKQASASGLSADETNALQADRRSRTLLVWLGAIVSVSGFLVAIVLTMLLSQEVPGDMREPVEIGPASAFLGHEGQPQLIANKRSWMVEIDGGLIALVNRSPHAGCRLHWKVDLDRFIDPCHGQIHLLDGAFEKGPTAQDMRRYTILALDADRQVIGRTNDASDPLVVAPETLLYLDVAEKSEGVPASSSNTGSTDGR